MFPTGKNNTVKSRSKIVISFLLSPPPAGPLALHHLSLAATCLCPPRPSERIPSDNRTVGLTERRMSLRGTHSSGLTESDKPQSAVTRRGRGRGLSGRQVLRKWHCRGGASGLSLFPNSQRAGRLSQVTVQQLQRLRPEGQSNSRHDWLNAFLSHFAPLRFILRSRQASVDLARQTRGLKKGTFLHGPTCPVPNHHKAN